MKSRIYIIPMNPFFYAFSEDQSIPYQLNYIEIPKKTSFMFLVTETKGSENYFSIKLEYFYIWLSTLEKSDFSRKIECISINAKDEKKVRKEQK